MTTSQVLGLFSLGIFTACAAASIDEVDPSDGTLETGELVAVTLPSGALQAKVVDIANAGGLLDAVTHNDNAYIHDLAAGAWYYKSGNYLLGIESFLRAHDGIRQVGLEGRFAARPARSQHVEADTPDDRRQPRAQVVDIAPVGAAEPEPGLLDRVVGLGQ